MRLHRIHLDPRSREARRDLADPYQMHATLCRAFFPEDTTCPPGALLWRLEPETDAKGRPRALIQSRTEPAWSRIPYANWLACADPGIDLAQKLALEALTVGRQFRFRLRANPSKTVQGKRQGILRPDAQRAWLERKGSQHGFALPDLCITHEQILTGKQHGGGIIRVYSVLFEGRLQVTDPARFKQALETGIGHGKVMGLGLLSVVPSAT